MSGPSVPSNIRGIYEYTTPHNGRPAYTHTTQGTVIYHHSEEGTTCERWNIGTSVGSPDAMLYRYHLVVVVVPCVVLGGRDTTIDMGQKLSHLWLTVSAYRHLKSTCGNINFTRNYNFTCRVNWQISMQRCNNVIFLQPMIILLISTCRVNIWFNSYLHITQIGYRILFYTNKGIRISFVAYIHCMISLQRNWFELVVLINILIRPVSYQYP